MDNLSIRLRVVCNWRRVRAIEEKAVADFRRARKRDRPAIYSRAVRDMAACVRVEVAS